MMRFGLLIAAMMFLLPAVLEADIPTDMSGSAASKPSATLCDPDATPEARALMASLVESFGAGTLSGVYSQEDAELVERVAGKTPAILGGDLMDFTPSRLARGAKPGPLVERLIAQSRAGRMITVLWHWNAPAHLIDCKYIGEDGKEVDARWFRGFYTAATTFDVRAAMDDPASMEYRLLVQDIDAIAEQLQKLADAKVPVLWRPLHEAQGGWFWWGAKGREPFLKLWALMYDRLVRQHQLHNLIWVYTSEGDPRWYPGDAMVDIVGVDAYPQDVHDPLIEKWQKHRQTIASRKLLALTEFGGVPDVDRMFKSGVQWSFFVSWTAQQGPAKMKPDDLKRIYGSDRVISLGAGSGATTMPVGNADLPAESPAGR